MEDTSGRETTTKKSGPKAGKLALDFANVFKAFIGLNYLSAAFNFSQAGLVLGSIGMVLIATATVHCCHLIVKCKTMAIHKILEIQDDFVDSTAEAIINPSRLQLRKRIERRLSYGDVAWIAAGKWGLRLVNFALVVTQFGFCVGYFIFLGNTFCNFFPLVNGTVPYYPTNSTLPPSIIENSTPEPLTEIVTMVTNINSTIVDNTMSLDYTTSPSSKFGPAAYHSGPSEAYYYFVAGLVFVFCGFALLRNIRNMGAASLVANVCVLIGYFAVLGYMLSDFQISDSIELFRWSTFPIFFGGITAGYEGIGVIIPIESSLEENRPYYPHLLYAAMILFTFILASLGILGYLHYGDQIQQVIIWNLETNSILPYIVYSVICVGVVFTWPLVNFPVIEIFEELLFAEGRLFGPPKVQKVFVNDENSRDLEQNGFNESSPLLLDYQPGSTDEQKEMAEIMKKLPVAAVIPDSVATWKRNILRFVIVVLQAGVAIIFRDDFAYFSAFIGAVGSTMLGYIIPSWIHIVLGGRQLGWPIITKDVVLILFGICGGVASVYASVEGIINK